MVELFEVGPEDVDDLVGYLAQVEGERDDEWKSADLWRSRLRMWWDLNPALSGRTPRGWGLRDGGRIVGVLGNVPTRFRLLGEEVVACNTSIWSVLPEHRGGSLGPLLQILQAGRRTILFTTTPSDHVIAIIQALKCRRFPHAVTRRSVLCIRPGRVLASRLARRGPLGALGWLAAPLVGGVQAWRARRARASGWDVGPVGRADASFDDLWGRTKAIYENTNVRTAEVLNWFCWGSPYFPKHLVAASRGGRLGGFAIFRVRRSPPLVVLDCLDLWTDPDAPGATAALVVGTRELARREGCDLALFPHFAAHLAARLRGLGLFEAPAPPTHDFLRATEGVMDRITAANSYLVVQGDVVL
jgi:hypothetical protein